MSKDQWMQASVALVAAAAEALTVAWGYEAAQGAPAPGTTAP